MEQDVIVYSPFTETFGDGKIILGNDLFNPGRYQIRTHVGEIGIASVVILQVVSCFLQTGRNGRKALCFTGIFHDTRSRLGGVSANDGYQAPVGAEAVGIEMGKQDTFFGKFVHIDRYTGFTTECFHQM